MAKALKKSIPKEVCAFLNTRGGVVLIGVEDDGNVEELTDEEYRKCEEDVSNIISERFDSCVGNFYSIKIIDLSERKYIVGIFVKYFLHDIFPASIENGNRTEVFYSRVGTKSQKMSRKEIIRMSKNNESRTGCDIEYDPNNFVSYTAEEVPMNDERMITLLKEKNIEDPSLRSYIIYNSKGNINIANYLCEKIKKQTFSVGTFRKWYNDEYFVKKIGEKKFEPTVRIILLGLSLGFRNSNLVNFLMKNKNLSAYEMEASMALLSEKGFLDLSQKSSLLPKIIEVNMVRKSFLEYEEQLIDDFVVESAIKDESVTCNLLLAYKEKKYETSEYGYGNIPKWLEKVILCNKNPEQSCSIFSSIGKEESYFLIKNINKSIKLSYFSLNALHHLKEGVLGLILENILKNQDEREKLLDNLDDWIRISIERKELLFNSVELVAKENIKNPFFYKVVELIISPIFCEENHWAEGRQFIMRYRSNVISSDCYVKLAILRNKVLKLFDDVAFDNVLWTKLTEISNARVWVVAVTRNNMTISEEQEKNIMEYGKKSFSKIIFMMEEKLKGKDVNYAMIKKIQQDNPYKDHDEKIIKLFPILVESEQAIVFPAWSEVRYLEQHLQSERFDKVAEKYYGFGKEAISKISLLEGKYYYSADLSRHLFDKVLKKISDEEIASWMKYVLNNQEKLKLCLVERFIYETVERKLFAWNKYADSLVSELKDKILPYCLIEKTEKIPPDDLSFLLDNLKSANAKKELADKILFYLPKERPFPTMVEKYLAESSDHEVQNLFIINFVLNNSIELERRKKYFKKFINIMKKCTIKHRDDLEDVYDAEGVLVVPLSYLNNFLEGTSPLIEKEYVIDAVIESITRAQKSSESDLHGIFHSVLNRHLKNTSIAFKKNILVKLCSQERIVNFFSYLNEIIILCMSDDTDFYSWFLGEKCFGRYYLTPFEIYNIDDEPNDSIFMRMLALSEVAKGTFSTETIYERILSSYIRPLGVRSIPDPEYKKFDKAIKYLESKESDEECKKLAQYLIKGLKRERERLKNSKRVL